MTQPVPPPLGEPPRRTGARIALFVLFGILGLMVLTCGGAAIWLTTSEQGQQFLEAAQGAAAMAEEGQKAPGTDAMRALGCEPAMIVSYQEVTEMLGALLPEEERAEMEAAMPADTAVLTCQATGDAVPSCQDVASAYVEAVAPSDDFMVTVQSGGNSCEAVFDASGRRLRE